MAVAPPPPPRVSIDMDDIFFVFPLGYQQRGPWHFSTIQTVDYYFRMFKYQFSVVTYLATILRIKIFVAMAPKVVVELKVVRIPYLTTLGPKM